MLDINNAKFIEIKKSKSGSTYKTFIFECVDCGNDIKSQQSQLKMHSGKCRKCTQKKRPYEHILNELKHTCKKRNIFFNLNYEEFLILIKDKKCHYCDKNLIFNKHTRDDDSNYVSRAYQLDKKDPLQGYNVDNCVTCCWECNRLKSNVYTYDEFLKIGNFLKENIIN